MNTKTFNENQQRVVKYTQKIQTLVDKKVTTPRQESAKQQSIDRYSMIVKKAEEKLRRIEERERQKQEKINQKEAKRLAQEELKRARFIKKISKYTNNMYKKASKIITYSDILKLGSFDECLAIEEQVEKKIIKVSASAFERLHIETSSQLNEVISQYTKKQIQGIQASDCIKSAIKYIPQYIFNLFNEFKIVQIISKSTDKQDLMARRRMVLKLIHPDKIGTRLQELEDRVQAEFQYQLCKYQLAEQFNQQEQQEQQQQPNPQEAEILSIESSSDSEQE